MAASQSRSLILTRFKTNQKSFFRILFLSSNLVYLGVNRCSQVQCMNGGSCVETLSGITTTAYCNCKAGFTGNRCETEYFRCSKDGIFTDIYGCDNGRYLECVYYGQSNLFLRNMQINAKANKRFLLKLRSDSQMAFFLDAIVRPDSDTTRRLVIATMRQMLNVQVFRRLTF